MILNNNNDNEERNIGISSMHSDDGVQICEEE